MSNAMREEILELVENGLELMEKTKCPKEKEEYKMDIMELLCALEENAEILKIMQ